MNNDKKEMRKNTVKYKLILAGIVILILSAACSSAFSGVEKISQQDKQQLSKYLRGNWKSPEDYVVEKFSKYDIIFLGEMHRIKHDVELVHNLIPRLYEAGIYNLGIEFGGYEYQDKVDLLVTAQKYDENMARWLMFKFATYWGMTEYIDIYRKAWELNKSLPKDAPKFRVVNLGYRANWSLLGPNTSVEVRKKVFHKGDPDEYMAKVIFKEFVDKDQKALIYSGSHHAFTHYNQPRYDFKKKKLMGSIKNRMGNVVHSKIPNKVFNIFLYSPWMTREDVSKLAAPVNGIIGEVMKEFKNKRVGFDVKGSLFGKLTDDSTYYSLGYKDFTLSTFCDGCIFQKNLSDYKGCTVDTKFVTDKNLQEAINNLPNVEARKLFATPEDFANNVRKDTNMKKRFHDMGVLPASSEEK
ncbi:hypothetical protein ACFL3G_00835 [Planctomycetota bacterium]